MDRKSLIAIVLSSLVLIIWLQIQSKNNPTIDKNTNTTVLSENQSNNLTGNTTSIKPASLSVSSDDNNNESIKEQIVEINTDIYRVKLSSKNGVVTSVKLKQFDNLSDENIELIPNGNDSQAFRILWGDSEDVTTLPDVIYNVEKTGANTITFFQDFIDLKGNVFEVRKTYGFKEGEHLIELKIKITNSKNDVITLGEERAYSLLFGPQLGPLGEVLETQKSKQLSRRRFVGHNNKKAKNIGVKNNRYRIQDALYKWVGISGRYISMLISTGSTRYTTKFSALEVDGLNSGAQILLYRPSIQSSAIEDKYRIYLGPNVKSILRRYNTSEDNAFGINNADFDDIMPTRLLKFIEKPMYALLKFIKKITNNYGIAIILLTVFVRFLTLPIINKSKVSGERMKALGPKIQDIRTRYADDPVRMNQEVMALYKKEKVSPMSSMGPMFIQIPIFLTMYRVIYESFELWQAPFVGWITDLSVPDQLFSFGDFVVPFLGWNSFNLLPWVMLLTQFVSSFIMMRQQDQQSMGSAKMMFIMSYVFPFMIFFALYNSPSGLILYWVCSNIFTVFTSIKWKKSSPVSHTPILKNKKKKL